LRVDVSEEIPTLPPHQEPSPIGRGQGEGYKTRLHSYALKMRTNPTGGEKLMWYILRNKRFHGLKFRRRYNFGKYILDFYCVRLKLVIEVDGPTHFTPGGLEKDRIRDTYLKQNGSRVYHIEHDRLLVNTNGVLEELELYLRLNTPHPNPLPLGEGV
jgi:very-short-patch-repair endonuclease